MCRRISWCPRALSLARNLPVPVWVTAFLLWHIFYSVSFLAILSEFNFATVILLLQAFNGIWISTIVSLFRAAYYQAKAIPEEFKFPKELLDEKNVFKAIGRWSRENKIPARFHLQSSNDGDVECPRFCPKCRVVKPDRAHHCRQCERCVMRMDHHCPVLGNCVHFHNHKFFINFLLAATALCFFAQAVIFPRVIEITKNLFETSIEALRNPNAYTCVASGIINAFVCSLALSWFLYTLASQMMRNETTLEGSAKSDYGDKGIFADGRSDYSVGTRWENFKTFVGTGRLWFLPVDAMYEGNAYTYPFTVFKQVAEEFECPLKEE
ncbi:hypothetical protein QR680_012345 [Steinernema hermaphroditum]|uniref:Palmitoyltransferase n=1 Tax=Steinernema hermaphroditum TaxID=289476 RepID=A0AA39M0D4_9BILA|nr:hypothetical protein QR680_012345 [Steinernema hermaphroditum]